jgi:hypothetical protein
VPDPLKQAVQYQRQLFEILDEFFVRATGKSASAFATVDAFSDTIRNEAGRIAGRGANAFPWVETELRRLYSQNASAVFRAAKQFGGLKLVQGGSSRFTGTHAESVRGSLLYADTVLDPGSGSTVVRER